MTEKQFMHPIHNKIAKFSEDERHDYEQSLKVYKDLKT